MNIPKDAKMNAATRHTLQVQNARDEFYDVMADYSSFIELNDLTPEQEEWLRGQERCVIAAVKRWVELLESRP